MKFKTLTLSAVAASAMMFAAGCDIDQTQEGALPDVDVRADAGELPEYDIVKTEKGRMPDVDVDVKSGKLPKYDVEMADIDLNTKKVSVDVPDVDIDVNKERHTFKVPDIDVNMPDDDKSSD